MSDTNPAAADRTHHEVVEVAQEMERAGLVVGTAGNVSGRRADGAICLTPSSTPYRDVTADNLAVLSLDGQHLGGSGQPSTEKAMHLACYQAFENVRGGGALPSAPRLDVCGGPPAHTVEHRGGAHLRGRRRARGRLRHHPAPRTWPTRSFATSATEVRC